MQGWEISGAAFQRRALSSRAILTLEQLTQHTPPTTLPNTTTAAARNAAQAMSGAATGVEMEAGTAALAGRMSGGAADAKGPRSGSAATALVPARATLADLCNCRVLGQVRASQGVFMLCCSSTLTSPTPHHQQHICDACAS